MRWLVASGMMSSVRQTLIDFSRTRASIRIVDRSVCAAREKSSAGLMDIPALFISLAPLYFTVVLPADRTPYLIWIAKDMGGDN